jgi:hypothetical protein
MKIIGKNHAIMISCVVASALSSLSMAFVDTDVDSSDFCFSIIVEFLARCRGIKSLHLGGFDFGGKDLASLDLSRLIRLDLICCRGILGLENTQMPELVSLSYDSLRGAALDEENLMAAAIKFPSLTSVRIRSCFESSASLLQFIESCPNIEKLSFWVYDEAFELNRYDFAAISLFLYFSISQNDLRVEMQERVNITKVELSENLMRRCADIAARIEAAQAAADTLESAGRAQELKSCDARLDDTCAITCPPDCLYNK